MDVKYIVDDRELVLATSSRGRALAPALQYQNSVRFGDRARVHDWFTRSIFSRVRTLVAVLPLKRPRAGRLTAAWIYGGNMRNVPLFVPSLMSKSTNDLRHYKMVGTRHDYLHAQGLSYTSPERTIADMIYYSDCDDDLEVYSRLEQWLTCSGEKLYREVNAKRTGIEVKTEQLFTRLGWM